MSFGRRIGKAVRMAGRVEALVSVPQRALLDAGRIDRSRYTLPHFLGLGAPKSGSTWLHHNLAAHPELFLPPEKEIHYFCHYQHHTVGWYAAKFAGGADRVRGEITPNYASLEPQQVAMAHRVVPEARLLLMIRHPIDRAWSHAQMNLARQRGRAVEDVPEAEFVAHFRSRHSLDAGDYPAIVDRWTALYPEDRLWIGTYDRMVEDPVSLLRSVFAFLGVRTDVDWSAFPAQTIIDRGSPGEDLHGQRGGGNQIPPRLREVLVEIHTPTIERARARFGALVEGWTVE
jgi:hypothetical protein